MLTLPKNTGAPARGSWFRRWTRVASNRGKPATGQWPRRFDGDKVSGHRPLLATSTTRLPRSKRATHSAPPLRTRRLKSWATSAEPRRQVSKHRPLLATSTTRRPRSQRITHLALRMSSAIAAGVLRAGPDFDKPRTIRPSHRTVANLKRGDLQAARRIRQDEHRTRRERVTRPEGDQDPRRRDRARPPPAARLPALPPA
jgi:hypothetical protein